MKKATRGYPWVSFTTDNGPLTIHGLDENCQCRQLIQRWHPGDQETVAMLLDMLGIPEEDEPVS